MQLFIDSANISEIQQVAALGIISGVTTNPSLLAKEDPSTPVEKIIASIHEIVGGHISVEVVSTDTEGMIREAEEILSWLPEATIKIPMTAAGLSAVYELSRREIPTNVTLVFSPTQALAAANAGARYVSIFLGRLDDIGQDGVGVLRQVMEIWDVQGLEAEIIAASIRHPMHIVEAARAGAPIATVPYKVLMQSLKHPLTDAGLEAFLRDAAKWHKQSVTA
ncbi:MAG: fructose-6-phosphate aldolase [Bacteroidota bacterium]|nr:fructose-6-phosphate aldolase [Candidatus Kapabacteria bacterium]MCS7302521.1 fructose-6-phosphate aldolase [Candidatus Kapabacteria bacterium]MCX7936793.1 fructose-6-phosphate aldolase [Chlorobiota bacterium]MDW8074163.1 fructose-6-phosphate aldolase [Bacteroidota bacterium]MDW8271361.1 fructose-6-phosphate aldolase [Bacteroidota bacterium]